MTSPIRGRAAELTTVRTLLQRLARGRGGVLIIEGPPGIGKTRLLHEVMVLATEAGARTLFGEGFECQRTVPFAPLFTATLRADPPIGDANALRSLGSTGDQRYWVVHDLQAAIEVAASRQPLAILLDDMQWADNGTLLALRSLTPGLADAPLLWVLTTRTGAGTPAARETVTALERGGAILLRLGAVAPGAVADIAADVMRAKPDESLLNLADKAHGNPFLVMELLQGLQEEDRIQVDGSRAVVTGAALPDRLTATMQERLDRLSEDTRRVVQVASVLPDRFSFGLLAAMLERRPVALIPAVGDAVRADLLIEDGDRLRFRHDILRQATRDSLPGPLRRAMERESATVLLEAGAAPEEVATQLARSADVGDRPAIAVLRRAAHSLSNSDPSTGADLSKRALDLLPARDSARASLVATTVVLLNRASRFDEARDLAYATLSTSLSPEEEAKLRLRLSMTSRTTTTQVQENLRGLELSPISEVTRARHLGWLAYNLMLVGQAPQDRDAALEASSAAELTGDQETGILAEVALAYLDCADGYGRAAVVRMQNLERTTRTGEITAAHQIATIHLGNLLAVVGRLDEATATIAEGMRVARNERNSLALTQWTHFEGLAHLAGGRLSAAREAVLALPSQDQLEVAGVAGVIGLLTLAEVAVHTDDQTLLREALIKARNTQATGSPAVSSSARGVLAHAAWQRDDIRGAVRWLADDPMLFTTPVWPVDLDQLILAARVSAAGGDAGLRAQVLLVVDRLGHEHPAYPLFVATAQHARGILERDPEAMLAAAQTFDSSGRPLLHAAAAEDAATELGRTQCRAEAIDQLNVAFDGYISCGAVADAHRVGRALRDFGVTRRVVTRPRPRSGWDSLTESETRVVYLVANGATNRTAAEQLHISPHTVNTHLRNAFAKLDVNSRVQLSQLVHGSGKVPPRRNLDS
jgi:DNA-binding CsgD family transcriptional regulator